MKVWEIDRDCGDYPAALRDLEPAWRPSRLYCAGRAEAIQALAGPVVTIVGARRASGYGLRVAERLAHDLALAGVAVVSGMARGIDGAAHRGALSGGGTTIAALAGASQVEPAHVAEALSYRMPSS